MENEEEESKKESNVVFAPPVAPDGTIHTLHSCIDVNDTETFKALVENGSDVNFSRKGSKVHLYL